MRYTGVISGHRGPVYYYVLVLIAGLVPVDYLLAGRDQTCVQGKGRSEPICTDMVRGRRFFFYIFHDKTAELRPPGDSCGGHDDRLRHVGPECSMEKIFEYLYCGYVVVHGLLHCCWF